MKSITFVLVAIISTALSAPFDDKEIARVKGLAPFFKYVFDHRGSRSTTTLAPVDHQTELPTKDIPSILTSSGSKPNDQDASETHLGNDNPVATASEGDIKLNPKDQEKYGNLDEQEQIEEGTIDQDQVRENTRNQNRGVNEQDVTTEADDLMQQASSLESRDEPDCCFGKGINEKAHDHKNADDAETQKDSKDQQANESQDSYDRVIPETFQDSSKEQETRETNIPEISRELKPPHEESSWDFKSVFRPDEETEPEEPAFVENIPMPKEEVPMPKEDEAKEREEETRDRELFNKKPIDGGRVFIKGSRQTPDWGKRH